MTTKDNPELDLLWGVDAIAKAIGRTHRQTAYMLSIGAIPGKKIGDRWVIERSKLIAVFTGEAA